MPILNPVYTLTILKTFPGPEFLGFEATLSRNNKEIVKITEAGSRSPMVFDWWDARSIKIKQEVYDYELRFIDEKIEKLCTPEEAALHQYLIDHFDERSLPPSQNTSGEADPEIWIMNELENLQLLNETKEILENICLLENGKIVKLDAPWDPLKRELINASLSVLHPSAILINEFSLDEATMLIRKDELHMKQILDNGLKLFLNDHLNTKTIPPVTP